MDVEHDRRHPSAPRGGKPARNTRWPARALTLLEISYTLCVEGLQEPLRRCLSELEKQLFAMAERAHHAGEQQDCFASRQRVLQRQAAFTQLFMRCLRSAFDDMDNPASRTAAADADGKSWQALELVDPGEQEVSMRLEQLGARGEVRHSGVLYELGHRMAVLIASPPLEGRALPIGPHALAQACQDAGIEFELPLHHQLLLLQNFDQWLIQTLAPLYKTINARLESERILPQLRSTPLPRHIGKRSRSAAGAADTADETGPARTTAAETEPARSPGRTTPAASIEVLESLRDLLARQRPGQGGTQAGGTGRAASEDELQAALSALQQHLAEMTDHASRELRTAARLREELLTQLNVGKPAGAPRTQLSDEQGDTVELVARLFEQVGHQLQSGGNASNLLSDLQLPVLRVAVADHGFFEKREHPARRLLDTVTSAANDWLDGSDDESNRPLAIKLEQLVNRANQEPPSAGLYTTLLADIEHHLALLTRKAQAAERRHVEAAQGRERLDQARHRAGELMAERFAKAPPKGLLRALLERAWSDVLALTLLRHGEDSAPFRAQLTITDQLLGLQPTTDPLQLQVEVESGLQQIGMHAEESVQVAQRLLGAGKPEPGVDLPSATDLALRLKQHQRLGEQHSIPKRPATGAPATVPSQPAATKSSPKSAITPAAPPITTASSDTSATPLTPVAADPRVEKIEQHLRSLPFGTWFEFIDPATGQIVQRKLAWCSRISGRCLLVSRRGQRGEEMTMADLAHEVASGRVCEVPVQKESLLDRAWRSLTGSLLRPPSAKPQPTPRVTR